MYKTDKFMYLLLNNFSFRRKFERLKQDAELSGLTIDELVKQLSLICIEEGTLIDEDDLREIVINNRTKTIE